MKPLEGLPKIASCSIRLGQSLDVQLTRLSDDLMARLTQPKKASKFPFHRLPEELQEMVLCHTDLIAPTHLSLHQPNRRNIFQPIKSLKQIIDYSESCCLQCNDILEVCTCSVRHAARPSKMCTCWQYPSSMFLVSRDFNNKARRIFFSRNTFVFYDVPRAKYQYIRDLESVDYEYLEGTVQLLRRIPPSSLNYMRIISLRLAYVYKSATVPTKAINNNWCQLASTIISQFNTSQLTIEIDFIPPLFPAEEAWTDDPLRLQLIWAFYQSITFLFKLEDNQHYQNLSV